MQINEGQIQVHQGESIKSDADFYTTMEIFLGIFTGQINPGEAIAQDLIRIEEEPEALSRFLSYCYVPGPLN